MKTGADIVREMQELLERLPPTPVRIRVHPDVWTELAAKLESSPAPMYLSLVGLPVIVDNAVARWRIEYSDGSTREP